MHSKNSAVGTFYLTTDRHEASRGLFATAALLVKQAKTSKMADMTSPRRRQFHVTDERTNKKNDDVNA